MATPCMVVSQQFCEPDLLTLYIVRKQAKMDGNFLVIDADGNVRFKVTGRRLDGGINQLILKNDADQPLLTLQQKRMTMHARWKVFSGDSSEKKDLLFSVKRSSIIQIDTELDVFLAHNTEENKCDFKLRCRDWEKSGTIYDGDINVIFAKMNKKENFVVKVNSYVDYAFIVALVLVFEGIKNF